MAAFFQWIIVSAISIIALAAYHYRHTTYRNNATLTIICLIVGAIIVCSPLYFEYADWGESVPVTFSESGHVIQHHFGVFAVSGYANMPTTGSSLRLVGDAVVAKDRKYTRALTYWFEARVEDPSLYYKWGYRRNQGSVKAQEELGEIAENWGNAFLTECPISISAFRPEDAWRDSVKTLFTEWMKKNPSGYTEGIAVELSDVDVYRR